MRKIVVDTKILNEIINGFVFIKVGKDYLLLEDCVEDMFVTRVTWNVILCMSGPSSYVGKWIFGSFYLWSKGVYSFDDLISLGIGSFERTEMFLS